jgi:flagellar biosynthesis protein FlhA
MAVETSSSQGGLSNLMKYSDIILAFAVVSVVAMMIIPLPTQALDVLIIINMTTALVVLLVSMYIHEPLEFSVFPSLLLILTLFRLGLNISASRLILLQGDAGRVIDAFGNFVVGGNYVVGIVVFLVLVVIQFVVITNGAGRVAEVAARFTLDAMPGKQMSIDADLNAGLISEKEARARRQAIEQEADFYGAMDGASKFVKGDAIAGIVIILINIFGGLIIGVVQRGLDIMQALHTYTLLTVGDGLVSQIPALLISTATGIIVTRAASESNLGRDMARQILANPRALAIVAALLVALGLVPGLPKVPFFVIAALLALASFLLGRRVSSATRVETPKPSVPEKENLLGLVKVDPMEMEIGYGLVPLVDVEQGGILLNRISLVRRQLATELGIVMPMIRVHDNLQLDPNVYLIKIRGVEMARGTVMPDRYLAMSSGSPSMEIDGLPAREPVFGLPALWISAAQREKAEIAGYTVVDASAVITTHLTEVIRSNAHLILGKQEVSNLINHVKQEYPAVVEDLIPELLSLTDVQRVLQNLLREKVPIRDMVTILETLAAYARTTKDTDLLTEYVRHALSRTITAQYRDLSGVIYVFSLAPGLEQRLVNAIQVTENGVMVVLEPSFAEALLQAVAGQMERMAAAGYQPVLLVGPRLRLALRRMLERFLPNLVVLSPPEIEPKTRIQNMGVVELGDERG